MTKAERRLRTLFKKWTPLLGLASWDIAVELVPEAALGTIDGGGIDAAADCLAHWEYERATIRFDEPWVLSVSDVRLEQTVVHELLHAMLNQLRRQHSMADEELTAERLTRALLKVAA